MKNLKKIRVLLVAFFFGLSIFVPTFVLAEDAPASWDLNVSVDVPASCQATDTDGGVHDYTAPSSDSYLGICAIEAAMNDGSVTGVEFSNAFPELGLFVSSINSTTADSASQYWALFQNDSFATLGLSSLPVKAGDIIKLELHDFSDNNLGYSLTLNINSLTPVVTEPAPEPETHHHHSGGGSRIVATDPVGDVLGAETKASFDLDKALKFLVANQKEDGSFGADLYTDWAALALSSSPDYKKETIALIKYLEQEKFAGSLLTDHERHAMALLSLGLNPYDTHSQNYIQNILSAWDGKQFGDKNEDNDDIFALIVLQNGGYTKDDKIIADDINFILTSQGKDGYWNESVDMTGAGIEALSAFRDMEPVKTSLTKAENFLKEKQKDNGGWNDSASSTAWAIEGILALGEKPSDWTQKDLSPMDYLTTLQDTDGGIKNEDLNTKIWETSYVIAALSGENWNSYMQKFDKELAPLPIKAPLKKTSSPLFHKKINAKAEQPVKVATPTPSQPETEAAPEPTRESSPAPEVHRNWFTKLLGNIFGF